jgi:oxaloacetate decarboxylase (Na+ extruding) subunit alpha
MAADVKDKILSQQRAKEWRTWEAPDLSLRELRDQFGGEISDEELLLRVYAGEDAVKALTVADSPRST